MDFAFMAPFKTHFAKEIESWLKNNPKRTITSFNICRLTCSAYQNCAIAEIRDVPKPGIYPFNRNVFEESNLGQLDLFLGIDLFDRRFLTDIIAEFNFFWARFFLEVQPPRSAKWCWHIFWSEGESVDEFDQLDEIFIWKRSRSLDVHKFLDITLVLQ